MIGWGNSENDIDSWVFEIQDVNDNSYSADKDDVEDVDGQDREVVAIDSYWGQDMDLPEPDIDLGGRDNLELLGYLIEDDKTTVKIRRKISNTGDKYDKDLTYVEYIYWAWGEGPGLTAQGLQRGRVVRR